MEDIKIWLNEERFPNGWQTKERNRKGVTILSFNRLVNRVEFGINEKRKIDVENVDIPAPSMYVKAVSTRTSSVGQHGASSV